jgi:DNA polymerase I-like protein with 3'-5' exonuclease and polymerase domains
VGTLRARVLMGASDPVFTESRLHEVVDEFCTFDEFVFDVETKGKWRLDPRRNEVFWIVLAGPGARVEVIPFGHPNGRRTGTGLEPRVDKNGTTKNFRVPVYGPPPPQLRRDTVMSALKPLFWQPSRIIGHNVKFDIESVGKYWGELPPGPFGDTATLAHLKDENKRKYKLGEVLERELGRRYDKSLGIELETYSFQQAAKYTHYDGYYTWLLWNWLWPQVEDQGLGGPRDLDFDLIPALAAMEQAGIPLDVKTLHDLDRELDRELVEVERDLYDIVGYEWNLNSNPQKQKVFYGKKSEGGRGLKPTKKIKTGWSTDDESLKVHEGDELVDTYLRYGDLFKASNTYVKAYLGTADRKTRDKNRNNAPALAEDGRVHCNFRMTSTVTGRLSCSEPNLQNIPRPDTALGKQLRSLFIAPEGHKLIVADYKQIEYVIMAHFSGDPVLMRFFEEGLDFHLAVAAMILGIPQDKVTKPQRTIAKNTNFAVAYGAGITKVAAMSGITVREAEKFTRSHRLMLPALYSFNKQVVRTCRKRNPPHVKTLLGRKRRLPAIRWSNDELRMYAERQAVNTVIQGSASDLNKIAAVRLFEMLPPNWQTLLTVHDEFVISVPDDEVEDAMPVVREAMIGAGVQELIRVPLGVDIQAVARWSDAKE